ncbi:GNAT family N-acetyltransferase [Breznakiella homolactica]|uniref:Probable N-acetyltransferase 14 n=1 Tax=Breznakiella homolactica TaxID=2798577 RepID=A0A7T7XN40_9SPIR|nr:GNAT family N-acetyltransferase [Breznakiella homolactica]QQO09405.1 GNAT family N-acetyltransferase [Breznakiella homolactica]
MNLSFELLEDPKAAVPDLLLDADPSEAMVDDYLSRGVCYAVRLDGEIAGEIVLLKTRPRTMEIMNVAVKESLRCRGIGKALVLFGIEKARESGCRTVEIGTGNPGLYQMMLYQRCGFRIVGVDFDFFRRNYPEPIFEGDIECRDMIRMSLDLETPND